MASSSSITSEMGTNSVFDLLFISDGTNETNFNLAFERSIELELKPQFHSVEDFDAARIDQDKIYVLSSFENELFKLLQSNGCHILGPVALLMALASENQRIVRRPHPCYNLIMRDCIVTFSNIRNSNREGELTTKIHRMGGQVQNVMTMKSTHLITETSGTEKYYAAIKNNIKLMLPSWVDEMSLDNSNEPKPHNDPVYEKHEFPLFHGLKLSVSNIDLPSRNRIRALTVQNGGQYSGQLKMGDVTHLLTPTATGEKFKAAYKWKIKCLKPEWFEKCLESKYVVEEQDFLLVPLLSSSESISKNLTLDDTAVPGFKKPLTSSPATASKNVPIDVLSMTRIPGTSMNASELNITSASSMELGLIGDVTSGSNEKKSSGAEITASKTLKGNEGESDDETRLPDQDKDGDERNLPDQGQNDDSTRSPDEDHNADETHLPVKEQEKSPVKPVTLPDDDDKENAEQKLINELENLDISTIKPNNNLDGFQILPVGFSPNSNALAKILKLINIGNGTRCDKMSSRVTHVITSDLKQNLKDFCGEILNVAELINAVKGNVSKTDEGRDTLTMTTEPTQLFKGISFEVQGYDQETKEEIEQSVKEHGGAINKKCNYTIVPPFLYEHDSVNLKPSTTYATCCWLRMCVELEEILPLNVNILYTPLIVANVAKTSLPLRNTVITLSQFSFSAEKEALVELITFLGGTPQVSLSRKSQPEKNILRNTHLITKVPEGEKLEAALSWKIKVVKVEWLYAIAKSGQFVEETAYAIKDKDSGDKPQKPVEPQKTRAEKAPSSPKRSKTPEKRSNAEAAAASPAKRLKTPELEPEPYLTIVDGKEVWKVRNWDLPELRFKLPIDVENLDDSFDTKLHKLYTEPHPFCKDDPPLSPDHFKPTNIFVTFHVTALKSVPLKERDELFQIGKRLGMNCHKDHKNYITHVLHRQKAGDKLANVVSLYVNTYKSKVVSPEWIHECKRQNAAVDEALFPPNYDKRLSLASQISSQKLPKTPVKDSANTTKGLQERQEGEACASNKLITSSPKSSTDAAQEGNDVLCTQEFQKQLEMLASATKAAKSAYQGKVISAESSIEEPRHRSFPKTETQPLDVDHVQSSQLPPITWSDQGQIPGNFGSEANTSYNEGASLDGRYLQKVFLFSSFPDEKILKKMISIVEQLGGKVLNEKMFNNECTHMVVQKLTKNEKMLSSIAAGKIIIHKDFIFDSAKAGKFVEEEKYVIGSTIYLRHNEFQPDQASTMTAVYRWHRNFLRSGEGAFADWCVILMASETKRAIFQRVLEAGGATIVKSAEEMLSSKVRLAFLENGETSSVKDDTCKDLMKNQVWCLVPQYFSEYLHKYPAPDFKEFVFPAAKKYLHLIRAANVKNN